MMQVPCADTNVQNTPPASVQAPAVASNPQVVPAVVSSEGGVQPTVCAIGSNPGHTHNAQPNEVRINYDAGASAARGAVLLCPIILPLGAGPFSITFNAVNTAVDPVPQTSPVQCTSGINTTSNMDQRGQTNTAPAPPPALPAAARRDSRASSVVSYATARTEPAAPNRQVPTNSSPPTHIQLPPQSSQNSGPSNPPPVSPDGRTRTGGNSGKAKTYYCAEVYRAKIRSRPGERTEWYESHGMGPRDAPPAPIRRIVRERGARAGCLHVHTHDNGRQAWMLDKGSPPRRASGSGAQASGRVHTGAYEHAPRRADRGEGVVKKERKPGENLVWVSVDTWTPHPRLRDVVLHFLPNGEPRWARESSVMQYKKDWRDREHSTTDAE